MTQSRITSRRPEALSTSEMNRRIDAVLEAPGNHKCADCGAKRPHWASFLLSPMEKRKEKKNLGVLICSMCARYHADTLGKKLCAVKYLKQANKCKFPSQRVLCSIWMS